MILAFVRVIIIYGRYIGHYDLCFYVRQRRQIVEFIAFTKIWSSYTFVCALWQQILHE